jgi:ATP-dependent Clp protease ATP-binding subunit ClpA
VLDSYSDRARTVLSIATSEARSLDHPQVGTEHLLLGLLSEETGRSAELLRTAGVTLPAARHMVAEVVGTTASVSSAELPFTARAHRALDRAARFSRQDRAQEVDAEHILLGVLDVEGLACQVLRRLGADMSYIQDALTIGRSEVAPVNAEPMPATEAAVVPLRCPSCRGALDGALAERTMDLRSETAEARQISVVYCTACGTALGVTLP